MEVLQLFIIYPQGYESITTVIPAESKEVARQKAMSHPPIKELIGMGAKLMCVNVNDMMAMQGYNIEVSRVRVFH